MRFGPSGQRRRELPVASEGSEARVHAGRDRGPRQPVELSEHVLLLRERGEVGVGVALAACPISTRRDSSGRQVGAW